MLVVVPAASIGAQEPQGLPVDIPREQLFVADQIFRYGSPSNYNMWVPGAITPHRHAMMMETLWYRDQETGERLYGVAASDPMYNEDYTQMVVELRDNLYWSDGMQFMADDLVFTAETLKATPGMTEGGWSSAFSQYGVSKEVTDHADDTPRPVSLQSFISCGFDYSGRRPAAGHPVLFLTL